MGGLAETLTAGLAALSEQQHHLTCTGRGVREKAGSGSPPHGLPSYRPYQPFPIQIPRAHVRLSQHMSAQLRWAQHAHSTSRTSTKKSRNSFGTSDKHQTPAPPTTTTLPPPNDRRNIRPPCHRDYRVLS